MNAVKLLVFILCFPAAGIAAEGWRRKNKARSEKKNRIARVEYLTENGSLYGADFRIDISPEMISGARYFEETKHKYQEKKNVPVKKKQWNEIEQAVLAIESLLVPCEEKEERESSEEIFVTDGPHTFKFFITWKREDGSEERIRYYRPSDRRFITVTELLREAADPQGRKITYYDAPVLNGIYAVNGNSMSGNEGEFSFQFTKIPDEENWRICFYYGKEGERQSFIAEAGKEEWKKVYEFCCSLNVENLPAKSRSGECCMTLFFSDGTQKKVKPDRKAAESMYAFFAKEYPGI